MTDNEAVLTILNEIKTTQAVTSKEVKTLTKSIDKIHGYFEPDGPISNMKQFQASCPREQLKRFNSKFWLIFMSTITILVGIDLATIGYIVNAFNTIVR